MDRQHAEELWGSEIILYDTVMGYTRHTFVQTPRMNTTRSERGAVSDNDMSMSVHQS